MAEYSIFMQYDPQDKIYVASVPELQGCMAHTVIKTDALGLGWPSPLALSYIRHLS